MTDIHNDLLCIYTKLCSNNVKLFSKVDINGRLSAYDLIVSKTCCCTDRFVVLLFLGKDQCISALKSLCNLRKELCILLNILAALYNQRTVNCICNFFNNCDQLIDRFVNTPKESITIVNILLYFFIIFVSFLLSYLWILHIYNNFCY